MTPANTTAAVRKRRGTRRTKAVSAAATRPDFSATPTPSITTSTVPSGGKSAKVCGISVNRRRSWSADNRLMADTVAPVTGWVADTPSMAVTTETTMTIPIRIRNNVTGSGNRLPTRSIAASDRSTTPITSSPRPSCSHGPFRPCLKRSR